MDYDRQKEVASSQYRNVIGSGGDAVISDKTVTELLLTMLTLAAMLTGRRCKPVKLNFNNSFGC